MRTFGTFLAMILLAGLLGIVAVMSIQNIEIVSIQFLIWQSVKLPLGVLLAFAVGFGLIMGSFVPIGQKR